MDSNIQLPIPDYEEPKELWAFFGLTAYAANLIEQSLVNLAVVLQLPALHLLSREVFEQTFEKIEAKTLGRLLDAARAATSVPEDLDAQLQKALEKRNYLIHRFFLVHAEDILSQSGRRGMIDELGAMLRFFKELDARLVRLYEPLWKKYGVNDEFMRHEFREMQARAHARDRAG